MTREQQLTQALERIADPSRWFGGWHVHGTPGGENCPVCIARAALAAVSPSLHTHAEQESAHERHVGAGGETP